jgi:hypothetical protein
MLKLKKKIDLLTKNNKIHNKSEHRCYNYKKLKKDELCWEEEDSLGGWMFVAGRGGSFFKYKGGEEQEEIRKGRGGSTA